MVAVTWQEIIVADPAVLAGKSVVKGTRLSVELVLHLLAAGWSTEDLCENYPGLTGEHVRARLQYAAEYVGLERAVSVD